MTKKKLGGDVELKELSVELQEALKRALEVLPPRRGSGVVMLDQALGRVLSRDIYAKRDAPMFDNSAMDGYAFRYKDSSSPLRVAATIFAGQKPKPMLKARECYKIMTGAPVPSDADTIAPFEHCKSIDEERILPLSSIKKGANLRKKAEEIQKGRVLLPKGRCLEYGDIALLAAQGITAIEVYAPLRIALLSSGNELSEPWEEAGELGVYNANAFGIAALLNLYGFEVHYGGLIADDLAKSKAHLQAYSDYDVIITTGGASKGEADYLCEALEANGLRKLFSGINVKPGKPTMMGVMQGSFVMTLPGNPLTTLLIAHTLAIPMLYHLQGATAMHHHTLFALSSSDLELKPGRTHLLLGKLKGGYFYPTRDGKVGAGMLTALSQSDAIAYIDASKSEIAKGELLRVVMLCDRTRSKHSPWEEASG